MTHHYIEETTIADMATVIFRKNGHTKLAKSFVEFISQEHDSGKDLPIEISSVKRFVEFLVKNKGYN